MATSATTIKITTKHKGINIHSAADKSQSNHIGVATPPQTYELLDEKTIKNVKWFQIEFSPAITHLNHTHSDGWIVAVNERGEVNAEIENDIVD